MKKRNLDGCFFRVLRDGKWENACFTDLTTEERELVCMDRSADWLKSLLFHIADKLQEVGEFAGIEAVWIDERGENHD